MNDPIFQKFDQVLGTKTPPVGAPVQSRADEIRALAKQSQPQPPQAQQPQESLSQRTGFAGTTYLGRSLGVLAESKGILETNKNADFLQKQLDERLASGKMTPERHAQLSKGMSVTTGQIEQIAPQPKTTGELVKSGVKAGTDVLGLMVGGGGGKAVVQQTLGKKLVGAGLEGLKSGIGFGLTSGLGKGVVEDKGVVGTVKEMGKQALTYGAIGAGTGVVLAGAGIGIEKFRAAQKAKVAGKVNELAGKIVQGKEKDIVKAKQTLSKLDVSGVKTYKDLTDRLDDHIAGLSTGLDKTLDTNKTSKTLSELGTPIKVGEKTIQHNFVDDAIAQLKDMYSKTNDPAKLEQIMQLRDKAQSAGLTIKEINNLAKTHGAELRAFNASGELASGLTKQAAENTRAGLKTTARTLFGDKIYETVDKEISNAMRVKSLTNKIAERVTVLEQKIQKRGFGQKVGRGTGWLLDHITGGTLKGLAQYMVPRGEGLKVLNALDLEKALQKNLNKLQKLTSANISEAGFLSGVKEFLGQDAGKMLKNKAKEIGGQIKSGELPMGMSIKDITRVHPEDQKIMEAYIDSVRLGIEAPFKFDRDIERLREHFGIPDVSAQKLATTFEGFLNDIKKRTSGFTSKSVERPGVDKTKSQLTDFYNKIKK